MARWNGDKPPAIRSVPGPPQVVDKRCLVCASAYRKDMERLLVLGLSYSEIARYFEAMGENITRKSLANHQKAHMWVESAAIRSIIEDKAREAMLDVEEHKGFLLTKRALLETMIHQGYKDMLAGLTQVEPKDLLAVVEKMERMEGEQQAVAVDEMLKDFTAFADAVKQVCPADICQEIFAQYERNLESLKTPVLEQLVTFEMPDDPPKELGA